MKYIIDRTIIIFSIVSFSSARERSYDHSTRLHTYSDSTWYSKYSICAQANKNSWFIGNKNIEYKKLKTNETKNAKRWIETECF